jgi:hypothetical protein
MKDICTHERLCVRGHAPHEHAGYGSSERSAPAACGPRGLRRRQNPTRRDRSRYAVWFRWCEVAGPMKWVQRRRAVIVRRAGRPVLCMGTRSTFGEYGGCSSAAERARQVFGRSPCRPVRVRPSHITRAVLASRAPLARRPSITLVRRDGSNRNSCEVVARRKTFSDLASRSSR